MEKRYKLSSLDGIEFLQVINQKSDFPEHYHDTFCISLIEAGIEAIKMGDTTLFTEKGNISINNPWEIHANPLIEESSRNSFTTLYLSPDLVDTLLSRKGNFFYHQQPINSTQIRLFHEIIKKLEAKNTFEMEKNLQDLLRGFRSQTKPTTDYKTQSNLKWNELMLLIDHHLDQKISLDFLSTFMGMNKYNFAKEFRQRYGLSPINYVLMKKIFLAKRLITKDSNLTQLAYQLDFSDQAHFSKHFKRFIGISPRDYKLKR